MLCTPARGQAEGRVRVAQVPGHGQTVQGELVGPSTRAHVRQRHRQRCCCMPAPAPWRAPTPPCPLATCGDALGGPALASRLHHPSLGRVGKQERVVVGPRTLTSEGGRQVKRRLQRSAVHDGRACRALAAPSEGLQPEPCEPRCACSPPSSQPPPWPCFSSNEAITSTPSAAVAARSSASLQARRVSRRAGKAWGVGQHNAGPICVEGYQMAMQTRHDWTQH